MAEPAIRLRPEAFDNFAATYDAKFVHRLPGRWLREAVWRQLVPYVRPGMRALDLGCGTGEDAAWMARAGCHVVAADGAPAMLRVTSRKAKQWGVGDRVTTRLFDLNAPGGLGGPFDLVLSNFGALNCAADLRPLAAGLGAAVAPGGIVAAVVMGHFCAWETLWHGLRLKRTALRRWRGRATADIGGRAIPIRYWSPREIAKAFSADFGVLSVHPVGLFLPPSDLFGAIERRPRLFAALAGYEARVASWAPLARLSDHHLTLLHHNPSPPTGRGVACQVPRP